MLHVNITHSNTLDVLLETSQKKKKKNFGTQLLTIELSQILL